MAALASAEYTGDGVTDTYAIPFPFLDSSHVIVTVDDILVATNFIGPASIQVASGAPAVDAVVQVMRSTPRNTRMVDFQNGSTLTESNLDTDSLQAFYILQEIVDSVSGQPGSGTVLGAGLTEAEVQAMVDQAITSSVVLQNVQTLANTNATDIATEITNRINADGILSTDITNLDARLSAAEGVGGANATAITGLDTRVTAAEGSITTNATQITALESTVNDGASGVAANASAISALDARVTTAESNITVNATAITSLDTRLTTAEGNITGNASAITALDARVTTAEGDITANSTSITALDSRLTTAEGGVTANAAATSLLETRVTNANRNNLYSNAGNQTINGLPADANKVFSGEIVLADHGLLVGDKLSASAEVWSDAGSDDLAMEIVWVDGVDAETYTQGDAVNGTSGSPAIAFVDGATIPTGTVKVKTRIVNLNGTENYVGRRVALNVGEIHMLFEITAEARDLTALTTTVGTNTSSITVLTSTTDGLSAQYTVTVDNNGYVSGFGLASDIIDGNPTSEFTILSDKFKVIHPANGGQYAAFVVDGGVVYMDNAMLKDASITNAKIANLDAGKINAGTLDVGRLGAQTITVDKIAAGETFTEKLYLGNANLILDGINNKITIKNATGTVTMAELGEGGLTVNDVNGDPILVAGSGVEWGKILNPPLSEFTGNLDPATDWTPGTTGTQGDWTALGGARNSIITALGPFEETYQKLWQFDADGVETGGYTKEITLDGTKSYRFIQFVKRSASTDGNSAINWGLTANTGLLEVDGDTPAASPRFISGFDTTMVDNTWYMLVGYIFENGHTDTTIRATVIDVSTGEVLTSGFTEQDFKFSAGASTTVTYTLTTTGAANAADDVIFGPPLIHELNGSEPHLNTLRGSGFFIDGGNVDTYIGAAAIKEAHIADASIKNAKIDSLAVSTIKIQDFATAISTYTSFTADQTLTKTNGLDQEVTGFDTTVSTTGDASADITIKGAMQGYGYVNTDTQCKLNMWIEVDGVQEGDTIEGFWGKGQFDVKNDPTPLNFNCPFVFNFASPGGNMHVEVFVEMVANDGDGNFNIVGPEVFKITGGQMEITEQKK